MEKPSPSSGNAYLPFRGNLLTRYLSDAILTSCYRINRLPRKVLKYKSALEIILGRFVNLSHLPVFGSTCFVHSPSRNNLILVLENVFSWDIPL